MQKSHHKNSSANDGGDLLGKLNFLPGNHRQFRDDGLRVEGEFWQDVLVASHHIICEGRRGRVLFIGLRQLFLPVPYHGMEPLHDLGRRRRRPRRAVPHGSKIAEPLVRHDERRRPSRCRFSLLLGGISRARVRIGIRHGKSRNGRINPPAQSSGLRFYRIKPF